MKISKILAGMSAAAIAASMLSIATFADDATVTDYDIPVADNANFSGYLLGEESKGENGPFADSAALAAANIKTITYTIELDDSDDSVWYGGAIGTNSDGLGWNAHDWAKGNLKTDADGNYVDADGDGFVDFDKEVTAVKKSDGVYELTLINEDGFFTADDTYAQTFVQKWGADITVDSITLNKSDYLVPEKVAMPTTEPNNNPELTAFLMFTDKSWAWGNWDAGTTGATDTTVKGDGTYTVEINKGMVDGDGVDVTTNPAAGATVFCVDIVGAYDVYSLDDSITATIDSIKQDGQDLTFDASKVLTGNIEDDTTNYRMEIYNEYGDTKADAPVNIEDIAFADSLAVTFTIDVPDAPAPESSSEEVSESESVAESESTSETESTGSESKTDVKTSSSSKASSGTTSTNPNTGAAALAAVGVALAGAAVVATKKRK